MSDSAQRTIVLVVEDDPHTLELLRFNLTSAGFDVLSADNASDAIERLHDFRVDVILCDVMIPGMDGFQLRQAIVQDPLLRDTPFIFLTAKTMPEDEIRGIQSGADEYITKPFDPDVLIARVQAVLARRAAYERMSRFDSLTQLLNRPTLEREIDRELQRMLRYPGVSTLVFVDIDGFKRVNDELGHAAGDRVLVQLSDVLRANTRSVDIAGRYGGEEFVLFLPETPEAKAIYVVERMQQHFRTPTEATGGRIMTFSAGISEAPRDGENFETLCLRADAAMYAAKRAGKAQVIPWRPGLTMASSKFQG